MSASSDPHTDRTDLARYHRQMLLPFVGEAGQHQLTRKCALIVGCGALGTFAADVLARAGVGTLVIVDRDVVELTNLQRQVLFDHEQAMLGVPKAVAARLRIERVNPQVRVESIVADVNSRSVEALFGAPRAGGSDDDPPRLVDLVLDGTDNFHTRYLLNDACVKHHVPLAYAGVVGVNGVVMTCVPGRTACLRCVFPEPPEGGGAGEPTCDTAGVLGPAAGIAANLQATEAIKILLGRTDAVIPGVRSFDAWTGRFTAMGDSIADPACPCCGERRFEFLEGVRADAGVATLCGSDAVQVSGPDRARLDLRALAERLTPHGPVHVTDFLLRTTLTHERDRTRGSDASPIQLTVFADGRTLVRGTVDPVLARTLHARYVGA